MKFFAENFQDLSELYVNHLQKALDMEQQITKALPTMIEKATDPQLKQAFQTQLNESLGHVAKVESLLEQFGKNVSMTCKVMSALVSEAEDGIEDAADDAVRDVTLIGAAQEIEHHEIAVYVTLKTWAESLGETAQEDVLESILEQEKQADVLLTGIARRVNITAGSSAYAGVR